MQKLKYEVEVRKFSELRDRIEIPKFQRGLVWGPERKKEFIKTLKAGLPVGVLLLYKKENKYLIVDGLQRFTTMLAYSGNYFQYIDKSEISDEELMEVLYASEAARAVFDGFRSNVKQMQLDAMREIIAGRIAAGKNKISVQICMEAVKELCEKVAAIPAEDDMKIMTPVALIVDRIREQAVIDDITVPVIVFTGKEDELAEIFQKLNQEGVKLSKYDVYAAAWINEYVTVRNDPVFIDYIIGKYEAARKDSELDIAAYNPEEMKQSGQLTVFEYAFALGKALINKCTRLFPKADDKKVDSIGFLLLAELLGLSYQKMGRLAEQIRKYEKVDFKKLKDAIVESASVVEGSLGEYIVSPAKSGKKVSLACHSDLQLASYIIVVFRLKYELTPENGLTGKAKSSELEKVKKNLHKHYLYDIIRGFWAGSGDSKLEEIIADPYTCRYVGDVDRDDFHQQLLNWLDAGNRKISLVNVAADTKLFLNYLLRGSNAYDKKINYDVEHCVPRGILERFLVKKGKTVPISPVCNLAYIPASDNRSKGDLTYYQRQADNPGAYTLNEEALERLGYPDKQELEFVKAVDSLTEEKYFEFLKNRRNWLLNRFVQMMYQ